MSKENDYDYENAPEALEWTDADTEEWLGKDDFHYDPEWYFDEEIEIQKAERDYEKHIDRMGEHGT